MSHPETNQREQDLAILAAGADTGWWNEAGQPAPFPEDFFEPNSDWRPCISHTPTTPADGEQPF